MWGTGRGAIAIATTAAWVAVVLPTPAHAAADVVCAPDGKPRATILYFHPGGFVDGRASDPDNVEACRDFAGRGYLTRVVDYPLYNLPGAVRAAKRAATRQRGPRYAVGDSAGGTLAALLAAQGRVDAAATFAAPMDLLTWPADPRAWRPLGAKRADRVAASPYHRLTAREAPMLVMHDRRDVAVPFAQATRFVRRAKRARVVPSRARHLGHTWAPRHRAQIARWLAARR